MRRLLFFVSLALFAGVTEIDAQSFLERLGQRAARAAEDALTRKAEQAVEQAIDKVSDPETYKKEGQPQDSADGPISRQEAVYAPNDKDFYLELIPPPTLAVGNNIEIQNGFYLFETGALDRTPVDLDTIKLNALALLTRPGDRWSGGKPVLLLEPVNIERLNTLGVDRTFEGRPCREVFLRIPFTNSGNEQVLVHIRCPRPTIQDPEAFSSVTRYIDPQDIHYELVAVRIFSKTGTGNGTSGSSASGGGTSNDGTSGGSRPVPTSAPTTTPTPTTPPPAPHIPDNRDDDSDGGSSDQGSYTWIYRPYYPDWWDAEFHRQLLEIERERKRLIHDAELAEREKKKELESQALEERRNQERLIREQMLKELIERREREDVIPDDYHWTPIDWEKIREDIENNSEVQLMEPLYPKGEDAWVEIVPPTPLSQADSIVLDIGYYVSILNPAVEKHDYEMNPVLLDLEAHQTRPGNKNSLGNPAILLDLLPKDYRSMGREAEYEGKPCYEIIVRIPFYHATPYIVPAHIICPRPVYIGDDSTQNLEIPPSRSDRVYVVMRIFQKVAAPDMGIWTKNGVTPVEYETTAPVQLEFTAPTKDKLELEVEMLTELPQEATFLSTAVALDPPQTEANIISFVLPVKTASVKEGDEWLVRVSLANPTPATIIPVRITAPPPPQSDKPDDILVKAGDNEAVYFRVKAVPDLKGVFIGISILDSFIGEGSLEYVNKDYEYARQLGLITLSRTGMHTNAPTCTNEWLKVEITDLGHKYEKPEEKWLDWQKEEMSKVYEEYVSEPGDWDRTTEELTAITLDWISKGYGFPGSKHGGEPQHVGILDGDAIMRDIAAGTLKAKE